MTQKDEKTATLKRARTLHRDRWDCSFNDSKGREDYNFSPLNQYHSGTSGICFNDSKGREDCNRNTLQFNVYHGGSYLNFIRELKVERIITKTE